MKTDNFIITSVRIGRKHVDNFIAYLTVQGLDIYYVNVVNLFGWDVIFGTADISMHTRAAKQCTIIDDVIYTLYGVFPNNEDGIILMHETINCAMAGDGIVPVQTTTMHIQIGNLPTL